MKNEKLKIKLVLLIIIGLILPNFAFLETQPIKVPETLEETKEIGKGFPERIAGTLERVWREEVLPLWQKMYNWLKENIWDSYIGPFFKREIEKRKPVIEEEFEKEKAEMKEEVKTEIPKVGKSLWERFKELIK